MHVHFIQHVPFESPGYVLEWAQAHEHGTSFTRLYETTQFPALTGIDLLVVMGGPMGVYEEDKYPWLKQEKDFILSAIDSGKKVLGICLGSQLIASALGARVYPNAHKEIGWWPVKKVQQADQHIFSPILPDEFVVFHWHGDTFDLPAGAIHLLQSDLCSNQAFLYRNLVLGLQFHMEAIPELIDAMIDNCGHELVEAQAIQPAETIRSQQHYHAMNNKLLLHILTEFTT
jgi:GMP synthase-like glutamine amidotransferase